MSKKHKQSTKFQALADSLMATRARLERSRNAPPPIADSRVLWESAPIVLKHIELQCDVVELTLAHPQPLMFLKAIDRSSRLTHFEICSRTSLPTIEAFVRPAESSFASGLRNHCLRAGLPAHAAVRPTGTSRPTLDPDHILGLGCSGVGKSRLVSTLTRRFPRLDQE